MLIAPNSVDQSMYFKLVDPTAGTPETALVITALNAVYIRDRAAAVTNALTALAQPTTAHTDNYGIEVSTANAPGIYRVDFPDVAFAAGVARVQLGVVGAAIDPAYIEVELAPWLTPITGVTVRAVNGSDVALAVPGAAMALTAAAVAAIWDELLTGATHNVPTSAGRRLRQIANTLIYDGTVVSSTTNTVVLDAGASAQNNVYRGCLAVLMSGLEAGQPRMVVEYNGASRRLTVDHPWAVNPALADEIILVAFSGEIVSAFGTVVSATPSTMKLAADASLVNNIYRYSVLVVTSATGADTEARLITSYDGATQTATVSPPWTVLPVAGATYKIMPIGRAVTESMSDDAISAAAVSAAAVTKIQSGLATTTNVTAAEAAIRGADGDTLETLSDQIDTLPTSAGAPELT